jgi:hypothetical protein
MCIPLVQYYQLVVGVISQLQVVHHVVARERRLGGEIIAPS